MGDIEAICSLSGSIVIDDRYEPIAIATWFDAPEQHAIRRFFEWNTEIIMRARRRGGYVLVTDSNLASRPAALERKLIATLTAQMPSDAKELNLGNYVVVDNPLVRGALTAMQWLGATPWAIKTVTTCEDALRRALEDLRHAGLPAPAGLDPNAYRPPTRPD